MPAPVIFPPYPSTPQTTSDVVPIHVNDVNYTVQSQDRIISYIGLTAGRTVQLQSATILSIGKVITISDATGLASPSRPITVLPASGETIGGASSFVITIPFGSMSIMGDGDNFWSIVGSSYSLSGADGVGVTQIGMAFTIGLNMSTALSQWLDTLPTDPSALGSGVWWNNGGIPTRTI